MVIIVSDVSHADEGIFRLTPQVEQSSVISDICNVDECVMIIEDSHHPSTQMDLITSRDSSVKSSSSMLNAEKEFSFDLKPDRPL